MDPTAPLARLGRAARRASVTETLTIAGLVGMLAAAGCSGDDLTEVVGDEASTTGTDTADTGTETDTETDTESESETTGMPCPAGTEDCPCTAQGECDPGLSCVGGTCTPEVPPQCGNDIVEGDEECDDGNFVNDDGCTNACTLPACGDGVVQAGEGCDDGNTVDEDECTNACALPTCGDGIVQAGEECDDADPVDEDECTTTCTLPVCGDGFIHLLEGEECDDGNFEDDDACPSNCLPATCGDGFVWAGQEECDDGENGVETDACLSGCIAASCGDALVWEGVEACDDGNDTPADGCNPDCVESGSVRWEQVLDTGPDSCDYFLGVASASLDGVVAVGSTNKVSDVLADCQIVVRSYTADGTLIWTDSPLTGPNCDEAWSVAVDDDGRVWVAGFVYDPVNERDQWLAVYAPDGEQQWSQTYDSGLSDWAYGVAIDSAGRGVMVGAEQSATLGFDLRVRVVTDSGVTAWTSLIDDATTDFARDVTTFGDTTYIAGFAGPAGNEDGLVLALDLEGNSLWSQLHAGAAAGTDRFGGVAVNAGGEVVSVGFETGPVYHDVVVKKHAPGGAPVWTEVWDNPDLNWGDRAQEVTIDSQGAIVVAGQTWTAGQDFDDYDTWLRKYDTDGNELWTRTEAGPVDGEDVWWAVAAAPNDDLLVAGTMTSETGCKDAVLRRYAP